MKRNFAKIITISMLFCAMLIHSPVGLTQKQLPELPVILHLQIDATIIDLDWNFDSTRLAFADGEDSVSVINVEAGEIDLRLERDREKIAVVQTIAWSAAQNHLLIANNLTKIWDYSEVDWLDHFEFPSALEFVNYTPVGNVDWHPDGERFAVVLRECEEGNSYRPGARVEIWDVTTSTFFQIAGCLWPSPSEVKWNPQGTQIAINGPAIFDKEGFVESQEIEIWDVSTRDKIFTISGLKNPSGLVWSPLGDMMAFTTHIGINQFLQVQDVTTGEIVSQTEVNLSVYPPLDWHPSENVIATGGQDGSVRLWNALDGSEIIELPVHEDSVYDVSWSHDGSMLASAGRDGKLFIWDTSTLLQSTK